MPKTNIYKQVATLRTVLVAILVLCVGVFLIVAPEFWLAGHPRLQTPIRELGGLLFASVAVALLWDLFSKRAFRAEVMDAAQISEDVKAAQLLRVVANFRDLKWDEFFRNSRDVIVLFCFGDPFQNYEDVLEEFVMRKKNTSFHVMLPDPEDEKVLFELARRFGEDSLEIKRSILKTAREFKALFRKAPQGKEFSISYLSFAPVFSYYIFDDRVILGLYKHRRGWVSIPAFVFGKGGVLYDFVKYEHDAIMKPGELKATRVFPESAVELPKG